MPTEIEQADAAIPYEPITEIWIPPDMFKEGFCSRCRLQLP